MMRNGQFKTSALVGLVIMVTSPFIVLNADAVDVVRPLSLEERVTQIENQLQQRNQLFVNLQYKISDIQQELATLRGTQEEHSYSLKQLTDRQRDIYRDVDTRLSEVREQLLALSGDGGLPITISSGTAASQTPPKQMVSNQGNPTGNKPETTTPAAKNTNPTLVDEGIDSYNLIFPLVRNKNYAEAILAYQNFIKTYPQSKFVPNAYYWLGQVYFVQGQLAEALTPFEMILKNYADFDKYSDVLLKVANIKNSTGALVEAKQLFQKIIADYPNSTTARMAEKRLSEIKIPE